MSALHYEVVICILTGDIVWWINGPYGECRMWNDVSIFRDSLMSNLAPNKCAEADNGYIREHPQYIKCPKGMANLEKSEFICKND